MLLDVMAGWLAEAARNNYVSNKTGITNISSAKSNFISDVEATHSTMSNK